MGTLRLVRAAARAIPFGLVGLGFGVLATSFVLSERNPLPDHNTRIDLPAIGRAFGVELSDSVNWLLVLSSSCGACLSLGDQLLQIKQSAACEGATLVPLIVVNGDPPDSMLSVLRTWGIGRAGIGGSAGSRMLSVRVVPSLIETDVHRRVTRASSPATDAMWPNSPSC